MSESGSIVPGRVFSVFVLMGCCSVDGDRGACSRFQGEIAPTSTLQRAR